MKIPVLKKGNNYYIKLPSELTEKELFSLEIFHLRDGNYLLTTSLNPNNPTLSDSAPKEPQKLQTNQISSKNNSPITLEQELAVVSKLMSVKFSERNPETINKLFTHKERRVFDSLMKKKHIWLFKGKKYQDKGVYTISNKLFSLWKQNKSKIPNSSLMDTLQSQGYMIIHRIDDAKSFSEQIKSKMAMGQVLGVRGFDEKYYVATKNFYIKTREAIKQNLKESMSLDEISDFCKSSNDACDVVLKIMSEEGEAIEKRKGVFSLVD